MSESNTRRIPLTQGLFALVDAQDYDALGSHKWHAMGRAAKYAARWHSNEVPSLLMHRFIVGAPDGVCVDHINGDTLDNRRCNLRLASRGENARNARPQQNATSRYKGVYLLKTGRWRVDIKAAGRRIHVGSYRTELEAARAYDGAAKTYHGEFAHLNLPGAGEGVPHDTSIIGIAP